MKLFSWNVNGIRSCLNKGFEDFVRVYDPDILCLQEIKATKEDFNFSLDGYKIFINSAEKKGYSGTALLTKIEPISLTYGLGIPEHDKEGRIITAEYEDFYLICAYIPNSQRELLRLDYRLEFDSCLHKYMEELKKRKSVILCGDLNVAHKEIDLKNPKTNTHNAGFTIQERDDFSKLLSYGYTDSFRYFYPDKTDIYSWWSYMFKAREKNAGWRIDYFVVSNDLVGKMLDAKIHTDVMGSDHCPVSLELE